MIIRKIKFRIYASLTLFMLMVPYCSYGQDVDSKTWIDNYISYAKHLADSVRFVDGEVSLEYSYALLMVANAIEEKTGNHLEAINYAGQAFGIVSSISKQDSREYLDVLCSLCHFYNSGYEYKRTISLCKDVLSEENLNKIPWNLFVEYANALQEQAHYIDAIRQYRYAISSCTNFNDSISCDSQLSILLSSLYNNDKAIQLLNTYLESPKINLLKDNNARFQFYTALGIAYSNKNETIANSYFKKAREYETDNTPVKWRINHYNEASQIAQNYSQRKQLLWEAVVLADIYQSMDSACYVKYMTDLGQSYEYTKDSLKAINCYNMAMETIMRNKLGVSKQAIKLYGLYARLFSKQGMLDLATKMDEGALFVGYDYYGYTHPVSNMLRLQLVEDYIRLKQYEEAAFYLDECEWDDVRNMNWNVGLKKEESIPYRRYLYYKGLYEYKIGNLNAADTLLSQYVVNDDEYTRDALELLLNIAKSNNNIHKIHFLQERYIEKLVQHISILLLDLTDNERKRFLSNMTKYSNLFIPYISDSRSLSNAIDMSLLCKGILLNTSIALQKQTYDNQNGAELMMMLRKKKREYSSLRNIDTRKLFNLSASIDSLERRISLEFMNKTDFTKYLNCKLSNIQETLQNDELAIDFEKIGHHKYCAFLITKEKEPQYKFIHVEDTLSYSDFWKPLYSYILKANTIYFSPIDYLFIKPVENHLHKAFPNKHIHRMAHLRALFQSELQYGFNFVAFGNPRYNDELTSRTIQRGNNWMPLPGTEIEIDSIRVVLSQNKGWKLKSFTKDNANEANFITIDNQDVNIIHFATHGFYDKETNASGLLLTGANRGLNEEYIPQDKDDGILTTEEIENMHFPNLQLVVLSACETGLGATNIDGVWGLQRAFRIAGAKNMIVSLNKVDDEATQAFMIDFYRNLASGMSIYHSFRNAQANADEETKNSFILIE